MDGTSSGASSSSDAHRPIPAADHATAVVSKADIGRPSAGVEEPSLATSAPLIGEAARESIPSTAGDQAAPAAKETAATAQPSAQRSTKCSALPPQPGIEPAGTPVTGSRSTPADDLLDSRDSTEGQAARANGTQSVAAAEGEAPSLPSNHVLGGESEAARAAETQSVVHTEGETPSLPSNHGLGGKSEEASRNVSSEGSLSCAPEMAAVAEQGEVPRETDPEGCADVVSSSSLEVSCLGGRATGSSSPGENGPCGNTNDGVTIHGREGSWSPLVSPVAGVDSTPRNACAAASTGSTGEAMGATAECPIYESVVALNSRQHWMYVQVIGPAPIDEKVQAARRVMLTGPSVKPMPMVTRIRSPGEYALYLTSSPRWLGRSAYEFPARKPIAALQFRVPHSVYTHACTEDASTWRPVCDKCGQTLFTKGTIDKAPLESGPAPLEMRLLCDLESNLGVVVDVTVHAHILTTPTPCHSCGVGNARRDAGSDAAAAGISNRHLTRLPNASPTPESFRDRGVVPSGDMAVSNERRATEGEEPSGGAKESSAANGEPATATLTSAVVGPNNTRLERPPVGGTLASPGGSPIVDIDAAVSPPIARGGSKPSSPPALPTTDSDRAAAEGCAGGSAAAAAAAAAAAVDADGATDRPPATLGLPQIAGSGPTAMPERPRIRTTWSLVEALAYGSPASSPAASPSVGGSKSPALAPGGAGSSPSSRAGSSPGASSPSEPSPSAPGGAGSSPSRAGSLPGASSPSEPSPSAPGGAGSSPFRAGSLPGASSPSEPSPSAPGGAGSSPSRAGSLPGACSPSEPSSLAQSDEQAHVSSVVVKAAPSPASATSIAVDTARPASDAVSQEIAPIEPAGTEGAKWTREAGRVRTVAITPLTTHAAVRDSCWATMVINTAERSLEPSAAALATPAAASAKILEAKPVVAEMAAKMDLVKGGGPPLGTVTVGAGPRVDDPSDSAAAAVTGRVENGIPTSGGPVVSDPAVENLGGVSGKAGLVPPPCVSSKGGPARKCICPNCGGEGWTDGSCSVDLPEARSVGKSAEISSLSGPCNVCLWTPCNGRGGGCEKVASGKSLELKVVGQCGDGEHVKGTADEPVVETAPKQTARAPTPEMEEATTTTEATEPSPAANNAATSAQATTSESLPADPVLPNEVSKTDLGATSTAANANEAVGLGNSDSHEPASTADSFVRRWTPPCTAAVQGMPSAIQSVAKQTAATCVLSGAIGLKGRDSPAPGSESRPEKGGGGGGAASMEQVQACEGLLSSGVAAAEVKASAETGGVGGLDREDASVSGEGGAMARCSEKASNMVFKGVVLHGRATPLGQSDSRSRAEVTPRPSPEPLLFDQGDGGCVGMAGNRKESVLTPTPPMARDAEPLQRRLTPRDKGIGSTAETVSMVPSSLRPTAGTITVPATLQGGSVFGSLASSGAASSTGLDAQIPANAAPSSAVATSATARVPAQFGTQASCVQATAARVTAGVTESHAAAVSQGLGPVCGFTSQGWVPVWQQDSVQVHQVRPVSQQGGSRGVQGEMARLQGAANAYFGGRSGAVAAAASSPNAAVPCDSAMAARRSNAGLVGDRLPFSPAWTPPTRTGFGKHPTIVGAIPASGGVSEGLASSNVGRVPTIAYGSLVAGARLRSDAVNATPSACATSPRTSFQNWSGAGCPTPGYEWGVSGSDRLWTGGGVAGRVGGEAAHSSPTSGRNSPVFAECTARASEKMYQYLSHSSSVGGTPTHTNDEHYPGLAGRMGPPVRQRSLPSLAPTLDEHSRMGGRSRSSDCAQHQPRSTHGYAAAADGNGYAVNGAARISLSSTEYLDRGRFASAVPFQSGRFAGAAVEPNQRSPWIGEEQPSMATGLLHTEMAATPANRTGSGLAEHAWDPAASGNPFVKRGQSCASQRAVRSRRSMERNDLPWATVAAVSTKPSATPETIPRTVPQLIRERLPEHELDLQRMESRSWKADQRIPGPVLGRVLGTDPGTGWTTPARESEPFPVFSGPDRHASTQPPGVRPCAHERGERDHCAVSEEGVLSGRNGSLRWGEERAGVGGAAAGGGGGDHGGGAKKRLRETKSGQGLINAMFLQVQFRCSEGTSRRANDELSRLYIAEGDPIIPDNSTFTGPVTGRPLPPDALFPIGSQEEVAREFSSERSQTYSAGGEQDTHSRKRSRFESGGGQYGEHIGSALGQDHGSRGIARMSRRS